jgi:hypothetical protein
VDLDKLSEENRGLLRLLEEESMFPGASDSAFFERIFVHFENSRLIHRHPRNPLQFVVAHCMNTSPTTYSVEGWVKMAQPSHASYTIPQLLQSSNKWVLLELLKATHVKKFSKIFSENDTSSGKNIAGDPNLKFTKRKNASLIQGRPVLKQKVAKMRFSTFRFNTQAFPGSGKCFFASKMSNSDFPYVFIPKGVLSRKNFRKIFHVGASSPIV